MKATLFQIVFFIYYSLWSQFGNPQLHKIDVLNYDFKININNDTDSIKSAAAINILALDNISSFYLDLANKGINVKKVMINSRIIPFHHASDKILMDFSARKGDSIHVQIEYEGIPADGLIISNNKYGKKSFFGDNWPNRAHFWLPVIDHLSDKALVSFTILAPSEMDVIASGKRISRIRKGKKTEWFYKTSVPLPPKVMVFGATGFNIKNYGIYHDIPVSGWIYEDSPVKGLDDYLVSLEALKFYDSLIGPYSFSKLANVQSKTRFGGMENAGNIFYYENSVDGKGRVENLVAHEVAHQWFGNSVTEKEWKDIWLSEGFATYLTDLFLEHKYGKEKLKERMKMERDKIIRYHNRPRNSIVYNEKNNLMKLLNPNSYEKGAWVLHMLRKKIGDEKFFKLLKNFYKNYQNKNASTSDFISMAEEISHQNLHDFFNQWLFQEGIPVLEIKEEKTKKKLHLHIRQTGGNYQLNLPVRIITEKGEKNILLNLSKKEESFELPLSNTQNYQLIIDPDIEVLYKQLK